MHIPPIFPHDILVQRHGWTVLYREVFASISHEYLIRKWGKLMIFCDRVGNLYVHMLFAI